jgi:capsular polysaccharide export protein
MKGNLPLHAGPDQPTKIGSQNDTYIAALLPRHKNEMINKGMDAFRGKNVLLLQGPVGPFFSRLARDMTLAGANVHKVNFNAGDYLFYPCGAHVFRGPMAEWKPWLEELLVRLRIEVVLLFGDCRPIHVTAHRVAERLGLEIGVFEEGYLRPHYITFERHGVNAHSRVPRSPSFYRNHPEVPRIKRKELGNTYWHMVLWGALYFGVGSLGKAWFPHYEHHRRMSLSEAWPWVRSAWRKLRYRVSERDVMPRLTSELDKRFFLVPLQVHNDSQISTHSSFPSIEEFIEEVIISFAHHAPPDAALVIKHHPMSRGYTDYARLIARLAFDQEVADRCLYIHDQHLPTLLKHSRGVVVVNSTAGLQALQHHVPVKALGKAIFDLSGLCHQGPMETFWHEAGDSAPDKDLLRRFVSFLIARTQLNTSFYKRTPGEKHGAQVPWLTADWTAAATHAQFLKLTEFIEEAKGLAVMKVAASDGLTTPTLS